MAITFTYTLDDLKEARTALAAARKPKKTRFSLIGWVLFAIITALFFLLISPVPTKPSMVHTPSTPTMRNPWLLLAPHVSSAVFWVGLLTLGLMLGEWQNRAKTAEHQRRNTSIFGMILAGLILVLAVLNVFALKMANEPFDWYPTPMTELLVCYAPLAVSFVLFILLIKIMSLRGLRTAWSKNRSFHRPKEMEFDDKKFIIRDDASEHHFRWPTLLRYRETKNLLIVHNEDEQMYLFPKRAFEAPEQLVRLRAILNTNIADGEFLPQSSAFPVALPMRVIPLEEGAK